MPQKSQKKSGKEYERFTRLPRNEVLDLIFQLFEEKPSWSFKDIRIRTEQPADHLKEILPDVAMLHRSGELNGHYTLLNTFKANENRVRFDSCGSLDNHAYSPHPKAKAEMPAPVSPGAMAVDASDEEEEDEDMEEIQ